MRALALGLALLALGACKKHPPEVPSAPEAAASPRPAADDSVRMACARAPDFDPYGGRDERDAMRKALAAGDFKEAVRWSQALLKVCPCDIDAHVLGAFAYDKLGEAAKGKTLHEKAAVLLNSLMSSGDGKTPETALRVISVSEEQSLLKIRGLRERSQRLLSRGGHEIDELEAEDAKTGERSVLYFNIDIPLKRQTEIFSGKR